MSDRYNKVSVQAVNILKYLLTDPTPKSVTQIADDAFNGNKPATERHLFAFVHTGIVERTDNGNYVAAFEAFKILAGYIAKQNKILIDAKRQAEQAYNAIVSLNPKTGASS